MTNLIKRLQKGQEGFTLIELLVVVAIIALLATFAVPKLFEAINKSKKAPGQADMQTISAALERFYLDSDAGIYPFANVTTALGNGYLKSTTTYMNGFKQPYLYGTTATGSGYILIDMQGVPFTIAGANSTVVVTCGANTHTFTYVTATPTLAVNAAIPAADLPNCVAPAGAVLVRN